MSERIESPKNTPITVHDLEKAKESIIWERNNTFGGIQSDDYLTNPSLQEIWERAQLNKNPYPDGR